ncbi:MAG: hypothetical protein IKT40_00385 [Bacilli bacterium]|nr:hypothetical protein [Bacilli bacterium]
MIIDTEKMMQDYALCYKDKTRIKFIEKYLSTFNASAGKLTPFNLFPRQKAFLKSIAENKASIAIKHRQAGITTVSSGYVAAEMTFAEEDSPCTVLCIGNKLDLSQQLVTKIRDFLMQVPRWFWGDDYYSPDPKSEKNKKDIFTKNSKSELELFNGSKVYARSSGPNAARGISAVKLLIFDEAAFIEDGLAVYSSAVAATASVPNSKIIMVSTPNGKDELYYNTYRQALAKENNYNAVEFKWFQDLRYNKHLKWYKKNEDTGELEWIIEETLDSSGTIRYDEEKWRKLEQDGWTPQSPWYVEICKSFNNDSMKIAQELDVSFMGSANNVVSPEFIEMQSKLNVREPLEDLVDPLSEDTWFWKPPIEGHRYICACIQQNEKVLTKRGLINVEEIRSDDLLITKDGNFTNIKHRKYRDCIDEDMVEIKLHDICDGLKFTHNHPIWCSIGNHKPKPRYNKKKYLGYKYNFKFDYYDADNITVGSWMELPNIYHINEISEDDMVNIWNDSINVNRIKRLQFECPLLDEDFWWYCGLWLAEGYCRYDGKNEINTVHNINECHVYNKAKEIIERLFNRNVNIRYRDKYNSCNVIFSSSEIFTFLSTNFGRYAKNKFISEWIKYIPKKYKLKLVEGYLQGDGHIKNNKCWTATSISKTLLNDIQDILFSCGIISSVYIREKEHDEYAFNKIVHKEESYTLKIGHSNVIDFLYQLGYCNEMVNKIRSCAFVSDDLSKIYIKVSKVNKYKYTGKVYNFETVDESHSYCSRYITSHNCDPSRGVSEDRTAIEIIDMDGRDENGMPIIEQVLEYVGKKLGDDIGGMIYQYATMYNNAFVVADATGGQADALLLTLINMGYKNLYYEDSSQKTYTLQNSTRGYDNYTDRLPGFHFQGNRYPVLSNFAGLVRNNEFKIRSNRVINELDTWIFKGDTGRMDHMHGSHDDTITCLAMALFVMQYSLNKIEAAKNKDASILKAYTLGGGFSSNNYRRNVSSGVDMRPNNSLPFYNSKSLNKYPSHIHGSYLWLLSGSGNKSKK